MSLPPKELIASPAMMARLALLRRVRIAAAREDVNSFVEYVMRDEMTGKGVSQAPIHRSWQKLADQHDRVLIWSHPDSGKTSNLAVARTLFELGRNHNLRFVILAETHGQAAKIVGIIKRYLTHSKELREVFPGLRPGLPWQETEVTVARSNPLIKDPSVRAVGAATALLSARVDRLVVDDILSFENARTDVQRRKLIDWFDNTPNSRLTADARVIFIGTAFHPDDLMHYLAKTWSKDGVQRAFRFPLIDDDPASPTYGAPRWPEKWPMRRIMEKRRSTHPLEFSRTYMCLARSDEAARFKREYIEVALSRGEGRVMSPLGLRVHPSKLIPGGRTYTGVDLGVGQKAQHDLTCFFTIFLHPDGSREVLDVESGRWTFPEIADRIMNPNNGLYRRYAQTAFFVEGNGAQDFLRQHVTSLTAIPIQSFVTTGRNKPHPELGVEGLALEMANGKWIIPNRGGKMSPEVEAWVTEMLNYNPEDHTGDRLMASWFAREAAVAGAVVAQVTNIDLQRR